MLKTESYREKKNSGFTLVELIVAIAVTGLIMGAIVFFMSISLNQYRVVNADVTLQMEGQAAIDYIGEFMMEAKYTPVHVSGTDYEAYVTEVPDIGVAIDESGSAKWESVGILLLFEKDESKLYAVSVSEDESSENDIILKKDLSNINEVIDKIRSDSNRKNLADSMIAERVSDFSISPSQNPPQSADDKIRILSNMEKVSITLSFDRQTKVAESEFRMRNVN